MIITINGHSSKLEQHSHKRGLKSWKKLSPKIKRNKEELLNIMILLLIIGDLQIPYYLLNPEALKTVYGSIPSWYPIYAVVGLISNIAIIIGSGG